MKKDRKHEKRILVSERTTYCSSTGVVLHRKVRSVYEES
jgi:hypothetical protein